jgi:uncharacterized membrane protein YeaQ/YmgE (transglycosylase-associated protein family)
MSILAWIVFGLLAGIIAKFLTPGRDPGGCIVTMLLGVVGAFVGGLIYGLVTGSRFIAEFDIGSMLVAVGGAIVVLLIYRALTGNRA